MDLENFAFREFREALRKDWVALAAGATITSFAAGVAHARGYFATLGFDGLVFSLTPEYYVAVGAVSIVAIFLVMGLIAVVILAIFHSIAPRRLAQGSERPGWVDSISLPWVLAGTAAAIAVPFIYTWHWLAPVWALFPGAGVLEPFVLPALGLLFVVGYPLAYLRLRGRMFVAFLSATLLVIAPVLAHTAGQQRAEGFLHHPDTAPRVLVWRNATAEPEGYIVAHQEGDILYLVVTLGHDEAGNVQFHSTVVAMREVARVDFIPGGASDAYAFHQSATGEGTQSPK